MDEEKADPGGFLHSPKNEKEDKKKMQYKMNKTCGQCDFQFETIKELMFHVKNSPGHVPTCVHCDSKFSNFNNYRHHVRKFHIRESEIVCQECGKTSKTQEQQLLHWNFVHKVEEDLYCNLCGRECQNMFKLRKHTKLCLTKDPDIAAQERIQAESVNERVRDQLQTWTHEQYREWQQRKEEEANKPKPSTVAKTPGRPGRKKKEDNGEKTPRKSPSKKRKSADNGSSLLYNLLSEFSPVKKLKPEENPGDFLSSSHFQAESNFVDNFFNQQQENGHIHVKDEGDVKGVKEECESEESDNNNDNDATNDDTFEDDVFNDSSFNTFDDSRDYNMNSDDENMFKAEVKLEEESGDEILDFDNSNNGDGDGYLENSNNGYGDVDHTNNGDGEEDTFTFPKSEVKEEKVKEKKKRKSRKAPVEPDGDTGDYPCEQCNKSFKTRTSLSGHVHQVHTKLKTCKLCKEQTTDLLKHKKEVHPETVYDPEQGLSCRECDMTFKKVKYLKTHIRLQHSKWKDGGSQSTLCPVCAKEVKNLNTHMRDNHPKEGEDQWPCDDCDKVFTSKRYLNKHVANCHKGKLICPYCSKLCTKSHIITAHKEQPSVCDICSAVFKNKHALSGHKRKVHAEKVMVTCPDCFQVFDTNYKLYNHRYAVHNLQDCRCEFCGGTYKNKKLLQVHKRVSHPDLYEAAKNAAHLREIQEYAENLQPSKEEVAPPPPNADISQPSPNPEPLQPMPEPMPLFPQY